MGRYLLSLAMLAFPWVGLAGEPVKKWVDKDGVIHFGDAPPPDAGEVQRVQLKRDAVENFDGSSSRAGRSRQPSSNDGYWICPDK